MTDHRAIVETLVGGQVKFIVIGGAAALAPHAIELAPYGVHCWCLDLPALIHSQRAAGWPKDLEATAELEALLAERERARVS